MKIKSILGSLVLLTGIALGQGQFSGGGGGGVTVSGAVTVGHCATFASSTQIQDGGVCGGGSPSFSGLTSGTNTTAAMLVGTGASLGVTGSGTIDATTLQGSNWASPQSLGTGIPAGAAFTTLSASSTVSGAGFINYFAAPPSIGTTTPGIGDFTTINATTSISVGTAPTVCGSATGCFGFTENSVAMTPTVSQDACRADSVTHKFICSLNNAAEFTSLMNFSTVNLASTSAGGTSGQLPIGNVGSAGLSGTTPVSVASTGVISINANGITSTQLAAQYSKLRCEAGIGDGLNGITAGTYLQSTCYNDSGVTWTITGLKCFTDNNGTSSLNAAGNTLGALLTGAVTCTNAFAAGTQSANVALTNGDYVKFTFVSDGTSKQTTWVLSMTQ